MKTFTNYEEEIIWTVKKTKEAIYKQREFWPRYKENSYPCPVEASIVSESMFRNPVVGAIRVMHWNILSGELLDKEKVSKSRLFWNFRKLLLLEEIAHYDPDVMTLVELGSGRLNFLAKLKGFGYEYYFNSAKDEQHGTGIFWKKEKFTMKHTNSYPFNKMLGSQVVTTVVLEITDNKQKFAVIGLHLQSKKDQVGEFQRTAQIIQVFSEIVNLPVFDDNHEILTEKGTVVKGQFKGEYPVLINGDFNGERTQSKDYKQKILFPFAALLPKYFGYQSLYEQLEGDMQWSSWNQRPSGVDKYTTDYMVGNMKIKPISCLGGFADPVSYNRFPNYQSGSDHLSLVCDVKLLDKAQQFYGVLDEFPEMPKDYNFKMIDLITKRRSVETDTDNWSVKDKKLKKLLSVQTSTGFLFEMVNTLIAGPSNVALKELVGGFILGSMLFSIVYLLWLRPSGKGSPVRQTMTSQMEDKDSKEI